MDVAIYSNNNLHADESIMFILKRDFQHLLPVRNSLLGSFQLLTLPESGFGLQKPLDIFSLLLSLLYFVCSAIELWIEFEWCYNE